MAKIVLKKRGDNPTDTIDVQLGRLISANAKVQAEFEERQQSRPSPEIERALLTAIINQLPELVYAKDTGGDSSRRTTPSRGITACSAGRT